MSDMIIANNDIAVINGDIVLTDENADVIQLANNRIMIKYGELVHHPEIGNNISSRVKLTDSGLNIIADECRQAILQGIDISEVIDVVATRDNSTPYGCNISYTLKTLDNIVLSSSLMITKI